MTERTPAAPGRAPEPPAGYRPDGGLRLAGGLLAGAGLIGAFSAYHVLDQDPFVVLDGGGLHHLDLTGWSWTHFASGLLMAMAGILVLGARRWTTSTGIVVAAAGVVLNLLMVPYQPLHSALAVGLTLAALRLLVRHRRTLLARETAPAPGSG